MSIFNLTIDKSNDNGDWTNNHNFLELHFLKEIMIQKTINFCPRSIYFLHAYSRI